MKKMGIIYGSSTGTCESIAQTIAEKLGVASVDVIDASKITTEKVGGYDILLLGTSTWGDGELQDDWYDAIKTVKTADLNTILCTDHLLQNNSHLLLVYHIAGCLHIRLAVSEENRSIHPFYGIAQHTEHLIFII